MVRRMLMVIGTVVGILAVAPAAHAATTAVTTDATRYRPGDTITATATGFTACTGKSIRFTFNLPGNRANLTRTSTVDGLGQATVTLATPNRPGNWRLSAAATGCRTATTTFVVYRPVYPPGQDDPIVASDAPVYTPGSGATISVSGFTACAGEPITFTITPNGGGDPIILTSTVNPDGTASVSFNAPGPVGSYTVVAHADGCVDAVVGFSVQTLPATGSSSLDSLRTAAIIAITGCGLVLVAWRRRRPAAA